MAALLFAAVEDYAAIEDFAAAGDWSRSQSKRSRHSQTSLAQSLFPTIFPVVQPFADWITSFPLSQHNCPPLSKFYSRIHELMLLNAHVGAMY